MEAALRKKYISAQQSNFKPVAASHAQLAGIASQKPFAFDQSSLMRQHSVQSLSNEIPSTYEESKNPYTVGVDLSKREAKDVLNRQIISSGAISRSATHLMIGGSGDKSGSTERVVYENQY